MKLQAKPFRMKRLLLFFIVNYSFLPMVYGKGINRDSLIINSFCQGAANNCASVALIKAAMNKYGYKNIFKLNQGADGNNITLKDQTQLPINTDEYNLAKRYAKFRTGGFSSELGAEKDSVLFYAYLSYACIAKFIQIKGYWGCEGKNGEPGPFEGAKSNFLEALKFITNTSICTDYCYRLLGFPTVENKIFDYDPKIGLNVPGTILYSWVHAVPVYNDQVDCHGRWLKRSDFASCSDCQFYIVLK